MTECETLQRGDWHFQPTVLDEYTSYTSDDLDEIAFILGVLGSDNYHHQDEFVRGGIEVEGTVMDEWKGGCDLRPIQF